MAAFKLGPNDPVSIQHDMLSKILATMLTYDQLDISNLASAEMVARQLQLLEEKQAAAAATDSTGAEESALFLGAPTSHSAVLVAPDLKLWISQELAREASVLKERRKAREERNLARKKDPPQK